MSKRHMQFAQRVRQVLAESADKSVIVMTLVAPPEAGNLLTWECSPALQFNAAASLLFSAQKWALQEGNFAFANRCDAVLEAMGLALSIASVRENGELLE